jgi:hypothetical protein
MVTVGILFLLQSLNIVGFDRTWPAILLVIGVIKLLQNNASAAGHIGGMFPGAPTAPGAMPQTPPAPLASEPVSPDSGTSDHGSTSGEVRNV